MKFNLRYAVIGCFAASIVTPAFAADSGPDTYKAKCAMCHGADGLGTTPAGKGKMPAYKGKLTDDQIKSAVAYIRTLEK